MIRRAVPVRRADPDRRCAALGARPDPGVMTVLSQPSRAAAAARAITCPQGHLANRGVDSRRRAPVERVRDPTPRQTGALDRTVVLPQREHADARTRLWTRRPKEDIELAAVLAAVESSELATRVAARRVRAYLETASPEDGAQLRERCPQLRHNPQLAERHEEPSTLALERASGEAIRWLARTYTPALGDPRCPQDIVRLIARVATTLDVVASGVDRLERTADRFRARCTGVVASRPTPAQRLAQALDWSGASARSPREFQRALERIARHQTAVFTGLLEGARELLAQLDPRARPRPASSADHATRTLRSRRTGRSRWWGRRRRQMSQRSLALAQLARDADRLGAALLGPRFVATYRQLSCPDAPPKVGGG